MKPSAFLCRRGVFLFLMLSLFIRIVPARAAVPPDPLRAVTAGNGIWLAAGENGAVLVSPDAFYWTNQPSATSNTLHGATYGAGLFVLVGDAGTIMTSGDGLSWTTRVSGTVRPLRAAAYGNGQFVAVGDRGTVVRSGDGLTWTNVFIGTTNWLNDIAFGNGVFVMVGGPGAGFGRVYTSSNGVAWSVTANASNYNLEGVTFGDGAFLVLGSGGIALHSTNGMGWVATYNNVYPLRPRPAVGNGHSVAVDSGASGVTFSSANGVDWSYVYLSFAASLQDVAFADGTFVAVGMDASGRSTIVVSSDGAAWGDVWAPFFAPIITGQPQGTIASAGDIGTGLYVEAVGNPPPTYQWRRNGADLPGATRSYLEFPEANDAVAGDYTVVVSNHFGSVTSLVATVTVTNRAPQFTTEPQDTEVALGTSLNLYGFVDARSPATLRWYFGGTLLPGQTNEILSFGNATALYAGPYFVVASNVAGVVTSRVATVTVAPVVFVDQPDSQFLSTGEFLDLRVGVSAAVAPGYQWYFWGTNVPGAIGSVFYRGSVTTNDAGPYFLVATTPQGSVTSQVAVVGVDRMAPYVAVQPTSVTALAGTYSSISAYAVGSPQLFFQWRKNGLLIGGANNSFLEFSSRASDAGDYDLIVRNNYGSVTSQVATLTVKTAPPRFLDEPRPYAARVGESAYFYSYAEGGPPPTYEWRRNGVLLPGRTGAELILNNVSLADAAEYSVVARNSEGAVTSRLARLVVYGVAPYFRTQPLDKDALFGRDVYLDAFAGGAPEPQYQWYRNGEPVPGATSSQLPLPAITSEQAGVYYVKASNPYGSMNSREVTVTVRFQAPVFTDQPASRTVSWGETVFLSGNALAGPPPSYQWLFNGSPLAGATNSYLYLVSVNPSQAGNYRLVASNLVDVVTSAVAVVTVNSSAPFFATQPASRTALWGEAVNFYGFASGAPPPGYQWLYNDVVLPGATNALLPLGFVSPSNAGRYRLMAFNAVGTATSQVAVLTVTSQAPVFVTHPTSRSVIWGGFAVFAAAATAGPPPSYQWLFNGAPIPGATGSLLQISPVTPAHAGNYRLMASNLVGVSTSEVAVLTVYSQAPVVSVDPLQRTVLWGEDAGTLYAYVSGGPVPALQWFFEDQPIPDATSNYLYLGIVTPAQAGKYTVQASNAVGVATSQVAVLSVISQEPVFTTEPFDQNVLWGDVVSFYAVASAGPPANYQWYFRDQPLPGETNNYLGIPNTDTNAAGPYFVIATNLFGSATSRVATLTIETAPPNFVTEPDDMNVLWGSDVTLSSYAEGGPKPAYQWRREGVPIPDATNSWLSLFNVTTNATGNYDVVATNFLGAVTSRVAVLTVEIVAPQISYSYVTPGTQVVEGTDVRIYGSAYGGPLPTLQLSLNGSILALPLSQGGGFLLNEVTTNDAGRYAFVASNFVGSVTSFVADLHVQPAGPLDRWTRRNPLPQGENLLAVAHGNGRFVAAGERGSIVSSLNGSNWTAMRIRADADLTGLAYGNGIWVCVSRAGNILTSTNTVQWLPRVLDPQLSLEGVVFADGRFVAVGGIGENVSLVSTNGVDWVRGTAAYPTRFKGVTHGNGRFVAVLNSVPWILISTNGLDWTLPGTLPAAFFESVAFGDGQFVAVGSNGALLTSPDGDTWTQRSSGTTRRLIEAARGNGRWVAVGVRGIIQSSADGITWQSENSGTPDRLEGVTFASGQFVAVGENGTTLTSTNGMVWTKRNVGSTRDLDGIAIGPNGQIVAVGKFGTILTTPDGVHITERSSGATNDLHGVAYAEGRYVAVGDGGSIVTSSNGSSWSLMSLGANYYFKAVTYGGGLWVAVGTGGTIVTSTNGTTWTFQNSGLTRDLNDIAYGNGFFMVVGDSYPPNGTVLTSTDGVSWFNRSILTGKNFRGVTFADGLFLAVGNDGIIYATTDAFSWAPRASGISGDGRNLRGATYADGHWIVVGNDGIIITSTNSVNWTRRVPRTVENLHGVRAVNGTFVTIGNRGTILQSGRFIGPVLKVRDFDPALGFVFSIEAEMGRDYRLQASEDLMTWEDVLEFNNSQDTTLFLDEEAMFFPLRFYRVVSP